MDYRQEAARYRQLLLENVLPWWLTHAVDEQQGGLCTCIDDDGVIHNYDKYVWSQVRGLWSFAAAYNRVQANPAYLALADQLYAFCRRFGRNDAGDWLFRLTRDGRVLDGPDSIQTDAYAICALVEYARASGNDEPLAIANQTFARTLDKLSRPGSYQTRPYPIPPGVKAQRVSMQFSLAWWELGKLTGEQRVLDAALALTDDVLDNYRRPEIQAAVEYLALDNRLLPPPIGTYLGPGHGIETAWFQIENLRPRPDAARLEKALQIMRWSFAAGWDPEFGGLFLGADRLGGEPYLPHAQMKLWWPHCEALCGALLAFEASGQAWCLDWYSKTWDWTMAHFPDHEHGEWTQRLDRAGRKVDQVVALPVKDPFHLPRALIYAYETLQRLGCSAAKSG